MEQDVELMLLKDKEFLKLLFLDENLALKDDTTPAQAPALNSGAQPFFSLRRPDGAAAQAAAAAQASAAAEVAAEAYQAASISSREAKNAAENAKLYAAAVEVVTTTYGIEFAVTTAATTAATTTNSSAITTPPLITFSTSTCHPPPITRHPRPATHHPPLTQELFDRCIPRLARVRHHGPAWCPVLDNTSRAVRGAGLWHLDHRYGGTGHDTKGSRQGRRTLAGYQLGRVRGQWVLGAAASCSLERGRPRI